MIQASIQIVGPFLSLYVEYLKVAPDRIALMTGLVFGITGVTNALTAPFWGKHADKGGYRKVLRYSLYGMTLFYLPQAFVTDVRQLLLLRAGLAYLWAVRYPPSIPLSRDLPPPRTEGAFTESFKAALYWGMWWAH
jgi:DHA1 family multidrug resistance protein-like MFS transporter